MSLLSSATSNIRKRVELFREKSTSSFPLPIPPILPSILNTYHNGLATKLESFLDVVVGKVAIVDSEDESAVYLGGQSLNEEANKEFSPIDIENERTFLAPAYTLIHDNFDLPITPSKKSINVDGDQVILVMECTPDVDTEYPYAVYTGEVYMKFNKINDSLYECIYGTTKSMIVDLQFGPESSYERGDTYTSPKTTFKLEDISNLSLYSLRKVGNVFTLDDETFSQSYTTDGVTYSQNFYIPWSITVAGSDIQHTDDYDVTGSNIVFSPGQISYDEGEYFQEFQQTQSPATLDQVNDMSTSIDSIETDMYTSTISQGIEENFDDTSDALPGLGDLDKDEILENTNSKMANSKMSGMVNGAGVMHNKGKTALSEAISEASVKKSLSDSGNTTELNPDSNIESLDNLQDSLGDTDISNGNKGMFDLTKLPGVISLQQASQFSTALFSKIPKFNDLMDYPYMKLLNSDHKAINLSLKEVNTSVDKII